MDVPSPTQLLAEAAALALRNESRESSPHAGSESYSELGSNGDQGGSTQFVPRKRKPPRMVEKVGWTSEEDSVIERAYKAMGPHWTDIAEMLHDESGERRSGDSVRNRWLRLQKRAKLARSEDSDSSPVAASADLSAGGSGERGGDMWSWRETHLSPILAATSMPPLVLPTFHSRRCLKERKKENREPKGGMGGLLLSVLKILFR